jgi:hypothetical protein
MCREIALRIVRPRLCADSRSACLKKCSMSHTQTHTHSIPHTAAHDTYRNKHTHTALRLHIPIHCLHKQHAHQHGSKHNRATLAHHRNQQRRASPTALTTLVPQCGSHCRHQCYNSGNVPVACNNCDTHEKTMRSNSVQKVSPPPTRAQHQSATAAKRWQCMHTRSGTHRHARSNTTKHKQRYTSTHQP